MTKIEQQEKVQAEAEYNHVHKFNCRSTIAMSMGLGNTNLYL